MRSFVYEWVDFSNFPKFEPKKSFEKSGNFVQNLAKIGPIGILNGSLFLAKLEFVCVCCQIPLRHIPTKTKLESRTWVPLRITDQLWAYWGNVCGPSVVFHHKSLLICWFRHCFVSEVLISTVVKFEKRKKKVCPRMVSRYQRGNLLWLNEDVTLPRWPPWEFCMA